MTDDAGRVADHATEAENVTGSTGIGLSDVVERWKQQFSGDRVSPPPASSASGPVRVNEAMIWRAAVRRVIEDCACGGRFRIRYMSADRDIRDHQRTKRHEAWRRAAGL